MLSLKEQMGQHIASSIIYGFKVKLKEYYWKLKGEIIIVFCDILAKYNASYYFEMWIHNFQKLSLAVFENF